ncbi:MAG: DUF1015 domain-containing protein [Eubacteriales bacterium]|nr:DUF1015 domain-containing protein [Eubacteriales bacterium]
METKMAEIRPFRPLRYTKNSGKIENVVSPPYDIISPDERAELVKTSEYNVVRLELPEGGDDKYSNAAALLAKWKDDGILAADKDEGIFIYSETFMVKGVTKTFYGMLCRVKLYDFSEKVVLPHEETLSKAKKDRFNLMSETFCNFSPVYSLYNDDSHKVDEVMKSVMAEKPEVEFADNAGVIHKLWKVADNKRINEITSTMADKQLFIADGHHRYETALNFRNSLRDSGKIEDTSADYMMMMLVDMDNPGLVVFPTHRLVNPPENTSVEELLEKVSACFDVEKHSDISQAEKCLEENANKTVFALYTGGKDFYLLTLKDKDAMEVALPSKSSAYRGLDVSVLHTLILDAVLGIDAENMALGKSLTYTRDIDFAVESVKNGSAKLAVLMNPTKIREIKDVSLAGDKMPQKSTYFYPKLITGLAINDLTIL